MGRIFIYDGRELPDPDPNMSIDEVRQSLTEFFPELSNATSTTKKDGDNDVITFTKRVGTKGSSNTISVMLDVQNELAEAEAKWPPFTSYHEGYAVIKEELDELWTEVKARHRTLQNRRDLYREATQVAAMAIRFMKLVKEKE